MGLTSDTLAEPPTPALSDEPLLPAPTPQPQPAPPLFAAPEDAPAVASRRRRRSVPFEGGVAVPGLEKTIDADALKRRSGGLTSSGSSNKTVSIHTVPDFHNAEIMADQFPLPGREREGEEPLMVRGEEDEEEEEEEELGGGGGANTVGSIAGASIHHDHHLYKAGLSVPCLPLELHMHGISMEDIHQHTKGSVVDLLVLLTSDFRHAQGLKHFHFKILGINGKFRLGHEGISSTKASAKPTSTQLSRRSRLDEEVLVRFIVAPVEESAQTDWIAESLSERLRARNTSLREAGFSFALRNLTISRGMAVRNDAFSEVGKEEAKQMSAMLLPIGISAAFTGVLVWLAAV